VSDDGPVLADQNANDDVLSVGESKTMKINFYKQTGKDVTDKKVYFKVTDADTNKTVAFKGDDAIGVDLYDSSSKKSDFGFISPDSNGYGVWTWNDAAIGDGNFIIKNCEIYSEDLSDYKNIIIEGEKRITVEKYTVKITSPSLKVAYGSSKKAAVKVVGSNKKPFSDVYLLLKIFTGKKYKAYELCTNSKGIDTYKVPKLAPGKHKVVVSLADINNWGLYAKSVTSYITVAKAAVKIKANKLSTTYKSGKHFTAKIIYSKTKKAAGGVKVNLKVYTGKKAKTVTLTSNSKGIIKYSSSKLGVGNHKVVLKLKSNKKVKASSKTSSIKVSRADLKLSAPSAIHIYKKAGKFTVTVKNKASGKAVKGMKVTFKIKGKKYTAKTNSKGKASFSTKSLGKGKHKVAITVKGNSKFKKASAKSSVKILKGKIPTKIIVKNTDVDIYHDQDPIYETIPGSNLVTVRYIDKGYRTVAYYTPVLKDANGRELKFKYTAEMWVGGTHDPDEVIKGKFGESNTYHTRGMYSNFKLTVYFSGNSLYKGCQKTVTL
jgi:hypothetical protein